jgi:hypothetical protein
VWADGAAADVGALDVQPVDDRVSGAHRALRE